MAKYMKTKKYAEFQEAKKEFKKTQAKKAAKFRKDENAPKRPMSGYFLFLNDKRAGLVKQGLSVTEVSKKGSEMWNALSEDKRQPWLDKAAKAKAKYEKDLAKYQKSSQYKKYMAEKAAHEAKYKEEAKTEKKKVSAKKMAMKAK